jgi:hypothetical protein
VWSYGVVVWEIMSRSEPFPGVDLFVAAHKIANEGLRLPLPVIIYFLKTLKINIKFSSCLLNEI